MFDDHTTNATSNDNQTSPVLGADHTSPDTVIGASPLAPASTAPDPASSPVVAPTVTSTNDLVEIKKKALDELSPLVGKLEQAPEEKYKTLMMMIQASDNQDLVREAYQAAQKITDEKTRAEALLNIVNEINYFTQKSA